MSRVAADHAADIIRHDFEAFHEGFRAVTRRAKERFEARDWAGIRRDTVRRLGLHPRSVTDAMATLRDEFGDTVEQRSFWTEVKEAYSLAILGSDDFELAQSFFNSLTRQVFAHEGIDPSIDFLSQDFPLPFRGWEMASAQMYTTPRATAVVMRKVLEDAGFRVPFRDIKEAATRAATTINQAAAEAFGDRDLEALDFLRPVFVRNKAAYLIGRARLGEVNLPLVLALLNGDDGLELDAVVHDESDLSIIFSFACWYFHADLASPRQVIGFLHSVLPRKRVAELYISLGYNKHGKTEFFSDLTSYIASTDESFVVAPGQPGLVMAVFTLPSYEFVFKVIRDTFPASKATTRRRIMERYRHVLLHDRVGRLVDFQEYEHLKFPRQRFTPELLEELLSDASLTASLEGDEVVLQHLYIGRRVTPLDVFLERAEGDTLEAVLVDWGNAVKELAAANIFAGDMLTKNFGVTRHGRVVFYDYDELCALTACNFRTLPTARNDDDELASEPWFSVADNDVFPEELSRFLGLDDVQRSVFLEHHADIFGVDFWRLMQERNREGEVIDFFPYTASQKRRSEDPLGTGRDPAV